MRHLLNLLEYDMEMNGMLEEFNALHKGGKLQLPSKYNGEYSKVWYVTKKQRKKNEEVEKQGIEDDEARFQDYEAKRLKDEAKSRDAEAKKQDDEDYNLFG